MRDERVGEMPPITVPVQEAGALSVVDRVAGWLALGGAVGGLLLLVVGVIMRPQRGEFTQALAFGFVALAILIVVFGYIVPAVFRRRCPTAFGWDFPRLANDSLMATLGIALGSLSRGSDHARHDRVRHVASGRLPCRSAATATTAHGHPAEMISHGLHPTVQTLRVLPLGFEPTTTMDEESRDHPTFTASDFVFPWDSNPEPMD